MIEVLHIFSISAVSIPVDITELPTGFATLGETTQQVVNGRWDDNGVVLPGHPIEKVGKRSGHGPAHGLHAWPHGRSGTT